MVQFIIVAAMIVQVAVIGALAGMESSPKVRSRLSESERGALRILMAAATVVAFLLATVLVAM